MLRTSHRILLLAFGLFAPASSLSGCNVEPDIVARASDSGLGLDNDSGAEPVDLCTEAESIAPIECEVAVPPRPDFDQNMINVTAVSESKFFPFGSVLTLESCEVVTHGWYWVDPPEYTRIGFCPQTCEVIDQWKNLSLEFGCLTQLAGLLPRPPRP